ncbi:hypothetical protein QW180_18160 [Vibrio sinaloensis]|nr:hypothetical protein [Vibrio sinaloensis]
MDSGCLTQTEGDALYRVANYYFVYQAMTVENVAHYEQLISDLFKVIEFDVFPTLNADSEVPELTKKCADSTCPLFATSCRRLYRSLLSQ